MYIDKFKKEDGYYDEDECFYEDAESFLQIKVFGFCVCGCPDENLIFIKNGLSHIDNKQPDGMDHHTWYENWVSEGHKIFGNEQSRYFFFYWCDKEELTDHGGSVPGWLTDKGKELLADLIEYEKEYEKDNHANRMGG